MKFQLGFSLIFLFASFAVCKTQVVPEKTIHVTNVHIASRSEMTSNMSPAWVWTIVMGDCDGKRYILAVSDNRLELKAGSDYPIIFHKSMGVAVADIEVPSNKHSMKIMFYVNSVEELKLLSN